MLFRTPAISEPIPFGSLINYNVPIGVVNAPTTFFALFTPLICVPNPPASEPGTKIGVALPSS